MVNLFVLALLYINNEILLLHRCNATFGNGLYCLVGGKLEAGETALQAIRREVLEEVGLDIPTKEFALVHTFHRKGTENAIIGLCFKADIANLPKPINNEPDKHDDVGFFKLDQLPGNIIPAHKQAVECIKQHIYYSEHGW